MKASTACRISLFNHGLSCFVFYFLLIFQLPPFATSQTGAIRNSPNGSSVGPVVSQKTATSFIILFCIFFLLGLFSVYARQCLENNRRARGRPVGHETIGGQYRMAVRGMAVRGLDEAVIASFPTFVYSSVKGLKIGKGSLECAVCLNEFADDEKLRLLPKCNHVFHSDCVDAWLTSHSTCPVCRSNLAPHPGDHDPSFFPPANSENNPSVREAGDRSFPDEQDSRVVIQVAENTNPSQTTTHLSSIPSRPARSWSTGWRLNGIFLRSYSTGRLLVQPRENFDRFTLRLPEEVRSELLKTTTSLNRVRSCVALGEIDSIRQGFRTKN